MLSPARTTLHRVCVVALLASLFAIAVRAEVVINEFMAAGSDRLLQYDVSNVPKLGAGNRWYEAGFDDASWAQAPGPFGYGTLTNNPPTPIATNLATAMRFLTPTVYLRKTFQVSAADQARTDTVQLIMEYNDGFVAYLNGVEIARQNGGPVNRFLYHDQPAYNREIYSNVRTGALLTQPIPTTTTTITINVGTASARLLVGTNVLSIHALNANELDSTFYVKPNLRINSTTPVPLVNHNDTWKYFPGVVEPAGAFYDPALLSSGKLRAPWGVLGFDDSTWASGAGPIGCGTPPAGVTLGTNLTGQIANIASSVYERSVFTVSASEAAETQPLQFTVQYDDGFVAYLNGVEIARRNIGLPNTFTPRDAVADAALSVGEVVVLDSPSKLLVTGDNVLAIQFHNVAIGDSDLLMRAELRTTGTSNRAVVAFGAARKYFIGTAEPVQLANGEEDADSPEGPDSAVDWIELHNSGVQAVSLNNWSLTDDVTKKRKWVFPNVSIPAGGYLVVVADGLDLKNNPGGYLHTNFSLETDGEYLGLFDAIGSAATVFSPTYPAQRTFQSFARTGGSAFAYCDMPTPGTANAGTFFTGIVATPTVNNPGRFYTGSASVTLSCATPGATIRVTIDGTEPTASSPIAPPTLTFSSNTALRARAFLANHIPSDTVSHTYLVNEAAARRGLPAVALVGDQQRAFYRPFGIMAIVGGTTSGNWNQAGDPTAYNAPMQKGKPAERPISLEILHDNIAPDLRTNVGVRLAGSSVSRPTYQLTNQNSGTPNSLSPWTSSSSQKPQFNLFFRDDIGTRPMNFPIVPGSPVSSYESIRLRSGKNEIGNPFIRDEYTRRLFAQMGNVTVRGDFVNLYLNGSFKGFFNLCERPREGFYQQARNSSAKFDVRVVDSIADGDVLAYNEIMSYVRPRDMTVAANYNGLASRLDLVNFVDYLVLNTYAGTWDWPQNNTLMDRERTPNGKFRFSVWDAEGAFGQSGRDPNTWNQFTSTDALSRPLISPDINTEFIAPCLFFTRLRPNPEFRLLFADRVRKHLFNDGALRNTNLTARWTELRNLMEPMLKNVLGAGTVMTDFATPWGTPRANAVLSQYTALQLWPATKAPEFSQFGGTVTGASTLAISNPNAGGTIYYTTNGTDPRAVGGAVVGQPYSTPLTFPQSLRVKARVLNGTEWSPVTEAVFTLPTALPLVISEIMYRPLDQGPVEGGEFEFVELMNVGATTLNLNGVRFGGGIRFGFPDGATLAAGARVVIAKNPTQFATRYPGVPVAGTFAPESLSNSGETLILFDLNNDPIHSFAYGVSAPWPVEPNTSGASLVLIHPETRPDHSSPLNWRSSRTVGGNPGTSDLTTFAEYAMANGGVVDPQLDPTNDGISLLLEYAFGRAAGQDPRAVLPTASTRVVEGQPGTFLALAFRRQLGGEDITYRPEFSLDLVDWSDGGVFVSSTSNGDGTATHVWRASTPAGPDSRQFGRVRVSMP